MGIRIVVNVVGVFLCHILLQFSTSVHHIKLHPLQLFKYTLLASTLAHVFRWKYFYFCLRKTRLRLSLSELVLVGFHCLKNVIIVLVFTRRSYNSNLASHSRDMLNSGGSLLSFNDWIIKLRRELSVQVDDIFKCNCLQSSSNLCLMSVLFEYLIS